MASYEEGKAEIVEWVKAHFSKGATCLDVGACDGKWSDLLGDYLTMDAVEIYEPNIRQHSLNDKYRTVYCMDVADYTYEWYDLIIFGDVIEHMDIQTAQRVLDYSRSRCDDMIVAVPFTLEQDEMYGNPYEKHIQDDLTPSRFHAFYPGFRIICRPKWDYAYYAKDKGSENMAKKTLDIIVNHYDEPWETGKPFFDMIEHQVCVDFNAFAVTLVHSGDNNLPWQELLSEYHYKVNVIELPDCTVSDARNAGLKNTSADWVMFCDFDDMFADVCALKMILDQFPAEDYDIIWGKLAAEEKWNGEKLYINCVKVPDFARICCKMFRRRFLEEKHISFDSAVPLYANYIFSSLALAETTPFRIAELTTEFYSYYKRHRENGITHNKNNIRDLIGKRFDRNCRLAEIMDERNHDFEYCKTIAAIVCSEYYRIYNPEDETTPLRASAEFLNFYSQHRNDFNRLSAAELEVVKDMIETETMNMIQGFYNDHKIEYYFVNDAMPFDKWLGLINQTVDSHDVKPDPKPDIIPNKQPETISGNPRVAVYCGTYNTYLSMMTSAKSLLWNTKMDKIYFLIEDDVFPYPLPDIVECINVKDQQFFPADGPNYNNSWSYMCMMRAAFTKLIPYDKILSLDIDIVVQEDIGCLWDIDLSDYYLAGVSEPQRQKSTKDPLYINFGVVMMNLAKLRQDGIDDKLIDALNRDKFGCPEQDAFNKFCAWHIYQLSNDYNATIHSHITGEAQKERIIHYAGIKFWRHFGHVKEYNNRPWDDVLERQNILAKGVNE